MHWFDLKSGLTNSVGRGGMQIYAAPVVVAFDGDTAFGALAELCGFVYKPYFCTHLSIFSITVCILRQQLMRRGCTSKNAR